MPPPGLTKAQAKRLTRSLAPARPRPVMTNGHLLTRNAAPNNTSDGVKIVATAQMFHVATMDCRAIRLVYSNFYNNAGTDAAGLNPITIKAAVRLASGTIVPVYFRGQRTTVVQPGGIVVSDPLGLSFAQGIGIHTRTCVTVFSGEVWPTGVTTNSSEGEGVVDSDMVDSGSLTASVTKAYCPYMVLGEPSEATTSPVLLAIGDSITVGYGDTFGTTDSYGWVRRAFETEMSVLNLAVSGSAVASAQTVDQLQRRLMLADLAGCDKAIVMYGRNDLSIPATAGQVQTRLENLYAVLAARGLAVYGATVTPDATSSDGYATVENQTTSSFNAARITLNTWIRTVPSPLAGVFDFADAVESARNSGFWKVGHTADGTHPDDTGYTAMAAIITPSDLGPVL